MKTAKESQKYTSPMINVLLTAANLLSFSSVILLSGKPF